MTIALNGTPTSVTARPTATVTAPIDADAFSSAIIQSSEQTLLDYIQGLIVDALLLSASNVQTAANTACVRGTGLGTGEGGLFVGGVTDAAGVKGSANAAGNGFGVKGYGAGTGRGVYGLGGATGPGVEGYGGATGSVGGQFTGTGNNYGVQVYGDGTAAGINSVGGTTGDGVKGTGGATSGRGGVFTGTGGLAGIAATGQGAGSGATLTGGATGAGLLATAGGSTALAILTAGGIQQTRVAPTYGVSVDINAALGNEFEITATNGVAFTINSPTSGVQGQRITIRIRNTSGGALGAITWSAGAYKMSAWTSPATANSRAIDFVYSGSFWVETAKTAADVPN